MPVHNPLLHEKRKCRHCEKEFSFYIGNARHGRIGRGVFCSRSCWHESRRLKLKCAKCGAEISCARSVPRKYCSPECAGTSPCRVESVCAQCGKSYCVIPSRSDKTKLCSFGCLVKHLARINRRRGIDARSRLGRRWQTVRLDALRRDGNRCQRCGAARGLVVHHKKPWRLSHDDSLDNLVTLCRCCHQSVEFFIKTEFGGYAGME